MIDSDLLYGMDPTRGIVAIDVLPETGQAVLFLRDGLNVTCQTRPFQPYLWLPKPDLLTGFQGEVDLQRLDGKGHYRWLALFPDSGQADRALRHLGRSGTDRAALGDLERAGIALSVRDPVSAFMARTGLSLFRGLSFENLHRMQIDVEAYTSRMSGVSRYSFSNPDRDGDRLISIGMCDNRGWETCLSGHEYAEKEMLAEFVRLVQERDPDVLEVFNGSFDLRYIHHRARRLGVPLDLGRLWDGRRFPLAHHPGPEFTRKFDPIRQADEYHIFGRQIFDVYLSLFKFDRKFWTCDSHGLKDAAALFGLSQGHDRAFLLGDDIADTWDVDPDRVSRYCLDDARDTRGVADRLAPAEFRMAALVPASYERSFRLGGVSTANLMMFRAYLANDRALARPGRVPREKNLFREDFLWGIKRKVWRVNLDGIYPALLRSQRVAPSGDDLQVFPLLVEGLSALRNTAEWSEDACRESPADLAWNFNLDYLLNGFANYLLSPAAPFNDAVAGVKLIGQGARLVDEITRLLERAGPGHTVEVSRVGPNGLLAASPEAATATEQQQLLLQVASQLSIPVPLEIQGRWDAIYNHGFAKWALLGEDGRLRMMGELRSRKREPILSDLAGCILRRLVAGDMAGMWALVEDTRSQIRRRELVIQDVARSQVWRVGTYDDLPDRAGFGEQVLHELLGRENCGFVKGDVASYYVAGTDMSQPICSMVELAHHFSPESVNVVYLLDQVRSLCDELLAGLIPEEELARRLGEP